MLGWNAIRKNKILKFNQNMKSDKKPYIIYADLESLIKKIEGCANNPEISSLTKIGEHIPCRYTILTIWAFNHVEDKHTLYCGKDCMKTFCASLREHTKSIICFEKKKMLPLTEKKIKLQEDERTACYICGK